VVEQYRQAGVLAVLDGLRPVEAVTDALMAALLAPTEGA
jgi:hypothetical protein